MLTKSLLKLVIDDNINKAVKYYRLLMVAIIIITEGLFVLAIDWHLMMLAFMAARNVVMSVEQQHVGQSGQPPEVWSQKGPHQNIIQIKNVHYVKDKMCVLATILI